MSYCLMYGTVGSIEEARSVGQKLVEEKLAACVNLLPQMESIYVWDGQLDSAQEVVLIAKTTEERSRKLVNRFVELHSYDCPAAVILPIDHGDPGYLKWITSCIGIES